jgi:Ca-activated chloride channel family protein
MPTLVLRPPKLAASIHAGALIACALIAGEICAEAFPQQNQNPNRPPWAQKSKTSDAGLAPAPIKVASSDPEQDRGKIKVSVNLVNVLVSVLDEHNRPAPNLPVEAFQVFDEDNPQKIAVFEKETQQPLDLALMIDSSLSAQLGMPAQREAANRFIQQVLRPGDHLAVYAVAENITQIAAFTDNVGHLQDAVRHIPAGAGTSIYDAVLLGSKALARQGSDRRHVIILITDGGETTSHSDFEACRREAVRAGTLLYTVVVRPMKSESGRNTAGEHALETITDTTGGAVFYPDSTAEIDSIFDRINKELRTQYRLGYYPDPRGPADTYRRIEVTVTPQPASSQPDSNHNGGQVAEDPPNAATPVTQPALQTDVTNTQPLVYSVRHRKSYYTGLP